MTDFACLAFRAFKELNHLVEKVKEHRCTAQNLEELENELRPIFEEIEQQATRMNLPAQETEHLKSLLRNFRETRMKYSKIEWWNFFQASQYKDELDKADKSIKDYMLIHVMAQTRRDVLQILENQMGTGVHADTHYRGRTFTIDVEAETIFPEFKKGLNSELMNNLKSLLKTDGVDRILNLDGEKTDGVDKILNLDGLTGTGKTALAQQLCLDLEVQGWFNGNVCFLPLGSKIESQDQELVSKLLENWGESKGLLVVDNVEPGSEEFFRKCLRQLSSDSKILVISGAVLSGLGRPVAMELLKQADAVTLLRYFAEPIGAASCNLPDDDTLRQVADHCGGFPLAIKMIGGYLRGKPNMFWQNHLGERQDQTIPDNVSMLLDVLRNSLKDSKEFKLVSEYFLDLALFPKHEIIPVSALFDIWVELYNKVQQGIHANCFVHRLTDMNLADWAHQLRETGSSHILNEVDDQFLTQHYIVRELAKKYSREQAGNSDMKRLIIETNACLASLKASPVAAPILSITTDQNIAPENLRFIQAAKALVLVLNLRTHKYRLPGVIKEMKNLKVLIVTNYGSQSTQLKKFKRLQSLKALKRIRLQHVTVPRVWRWKNLRKLSIYKCEVKTAFENSSMKFSKAMPNLVELRIEDSPDLEELPAGFWNIVNLKELSITKCRNFTKLAREIKNLGKLELLRISYCDKFEKMEKSISELQSLTFLDISHCRILENLPQKIGDLPNLTHIYMSGCLSINRLPDSVTSLKSLERVICDDYTSGKWQAVENFLKFVLDVKPALN